jgi:ribosomal protein S18 acetylase RimI-like enzyme
MKVSLADLTIRRPIKTDAAAVLALQNRCDIAQTGEADSNMEDLLHDWEEIDLTRDAWVALLPNGELVGYTSVLHVGDDIRYIVDTDPAWEGNELDEHLLSISEARGAEQVLARKDNKKISAHVYLVATNRRGIENVERAGFQPMKYIFQMRKDVTADLPDPVWPEGVVVRTADLEQDAAAIHQLVQTAFHLPGRESQPYADWYSFMVRSDIFQPDFWFLAMMGEEMIGVSLCFPYSDIGWVRQLAVLPEWQGRGLGAALLRHSFQALKQRGYTQVGLTVESERPDSYAFYQRVGMRVAYQLTEYVKPFGNEA